MSKFLISNDYQVVSSAPGKVILFGEHAVVHKVTAIAAALSDLRIFVKISPFDVNVENQGLHVTFEDFRNNNNDATIALVSFNDVKNTLSKNEDPHSSVQLSDADNTKLSDIFKDHIAAVKQCLSVVTYLVANMFPELIWNEEHPNLQNLGLKINIASRDLPVGAGLGSSAAFSVAMVGAVYRMRQYLLDKVDPKHWPTQVHVPSSDVLTELNDWAYAAEVLLHGTPSGLDNTTSCHGGLVRFTRKDNPRGVFETINNVPKLKILLTNTQVPRSTRILVEGVQKMYVTFPSIIQPIFDSIEGILMEFFNSVYAFDRANEQHVIELDEKVSTLFFLNHNLLNALSVGHAALTKIVDISHDSGFATKLTGAGGGGCAITLLNSSSTPEAIDSLKKALGECNHGHGNYKTFESEIGGVGLQWHKPSLEPL